LGEGDAQNDAVNDSGDDGDEIETADSDRNSTSAAVSTPEDIDNAVLELLASRDRDLPTAEAEQITSEPARHEEPPRAAAARPFTPPPHLAPLSSAPETAAEPPRRVARTSFSSFEPPNLSYRQRTTPSSSPYTRSIEARNDERSREEAPSPNADAVVTEPVLGVGQSVVADAPTVFSPGDVIDAPVADGAPIPAASADASDSPASSAGDEPGVEAASSSTSRSTRTSRGSGRSGTSRRARRPASGEDGAAATAPEATPAVAASGEAVTDEARAPRRRRTRRPAGAVAEGGGEAINSEAGS